LSREQDEAAAARLRDFRIELEMLIATTLSDVPISAIKKEFGSDSMDQIVAKTLAPIRRAVRRL